MNYEAQGRLIAKLEKRQPTEKFSSQEFIVEIPDGNYPQTVKFQASNANIDKLSKVNVGDEIKVTWNLRGKKYEKDGKTSYFNSLDCWKIDVVGTTQQPKDETNQPEFNDDENNLPF